jgi:hypothetical protein
LGARCRQLGAFVWSEVAVAALAAALAAAALLAAGGIAVRAAHRPPLSVLRDL